MVAGGRGRGGSARIGAGVVGVMGVVIGRSFVAGTLYRSVLVGFVHFSSRGDLVAGQSECLCGPRIIDRVCAVSIRKSGDAVQRFRWSRPSNFRSIQVAVQTQELVRASQHQQVEDSRAIVIYSDALSPLTHTIM